MNVEAPEAWMQNVAMEMNQAETAFFWPRPAGGYGLRWFTPGGEVDLCGHATLATAHVINSDSPLEFHTKSGVLRTERVGDEIRMDFPAEPAFEAPLPLPLNAHWAGKNRMDWIAVFETAGEVYDFVPDLPAIAGAGMRGLIITAPSDMDGVDFVSRFFAPRYGIPEDPVTGSAHCCLAPLWAERLGKDGLVGYQASRRGGYVGVRVKGDRVELAGRAAVTVEGRIAQSGLVGFDT